jgi:hypothetical protein
VTVALAQVVWSAVADSDPLSGAASVILQYGALGALTVTLLYIHLSSYRREARRADALEAELRRLNADLRDRLVPTMTEVVRVLGDVAALMRDRR